jgi:hypothetical protein
MAKDSPKNGGTREGSKYPFYVLSPCLKLAESVARHGGGSASVPKSLLSADLQADSASSAFQSLVASAKTWGIVQGSTELQLTELGRSYFFPLTENDKRNSVLGFLVSPTAFRALVDQLDGKRLPSNDILGNQLGRIGVPTSWRIRAAGIFVSAAKDLGVIDQNGFLRYAVEMHKAKTTEERIPLAAEIGRANHEMIVAQTAQPVATGETRQAPGPASTHITPGANVWVYSEGGGTVRLETPDPLPIELWKRLKRYVAVLNPEPDQEHGGDDGSK